MEAHLMIDSEIPTRGTRRGWGTLAITVAVITLCGFFMVRLTHRAKAAPPPRASAPPVVTVRTAEASYRTVKRILEVTGSVNAWDPLTIGAETNGLRIDQVAVDIGDQVRKGQVLAVLDSAVLRAQLTQQEARLTANRANAARALQPNRPQDIAALRSALSQAQAGVDQERANLLQAQANLHMAQANADRYTQLLGQGYATRQETDQYTTVLATNRAQVRAAQERVTAATFALDQARQHLSLALAGGRSEDVMVADAGIAETAAVIQQLRAQIAQTVIVAPDDGVVTKRDAHVGDITSPGKSLFAMVRQNRLELWAQVPQADLLGVRSGEPVRVRFNGREVAGRVRDVTPAVDNTTRLGTVRVALPGGAGLKPGMFVNGELQQGTRQALVVPPGAVLGQSDQYYLFLYRDGRAVRRSVTVRDRAPAYVEIASGLKAGDPVIVSGGAFLTDGDAVARDESPAVSARETGEAAR